MGQVKFRGKVVYTGPLADWKVHDGWNDSMAQYYPSISIFKVVNGENIERLLLDVDGFTDPHQKYEFDLVFDQNQVTDMNRIIKARKDEEEARTVRLHKTVRIVKGRKFPIGTVGQVFWMGQTKFGWSVGLRFIDGTKGFTALHNVEVENVDKAFEIEVLGLGTKKS